MKQRQEMKLNEAATELDEVELLEHCCVIDWRTKLEIHYHPIPV